MRIIYYQIKTQWDNAGDVLINKALISSLRQYGNIRCNCNTSVPQTFIDELGILDREKVYYKNNATYILSILKQSLKKENKDYMVSGLGHQWGGDIKRYFKAFCSSIVYVLFRIFNVTVIRIGLSIGPITKMYEIMEKIRARNVNFFYVRDTLSLDLCRRIGCKNVNLCPDMSWLYLSGNVKSMNQTNTVAVSLRESIPGEKDEEYIDRQVKKCDEILYEINKVMKGKMKVIFFYQVGIDAAFCRIVYNYFKHKYNSEIVDGLLTLSQAEEIYSQSAYIISNRMHSLLLGYKFGSLPVALIDQEKHLKISQTLLDNGLEKIIIDINKSDKNNIQWILSNNELLYNKFLCKEQENVILINNVLKDIFR